MVNKRWNWAGGMNKGLMLLNSGDCQYPSKESCLITPLPIVLCSGGLEWMSVSHWAGSCHNLMRGRILSEVVRCYIGRKRRQKLLSQVLVFLCWKFSGLLLFSLCIVKHCTCSPTSCWIKTHQKEIHWALLNTQTPHLTQKSSVLALSAPTCFTGETVK